MEILNIDDKALIIRNFLPENLLKKVRNFKYNNFVDSSNHGFTKGLYETRDKRTVEDLKVSSVLDTNLKILVDPFFEDIKKFILEHPSLPCSEETSKTFSITYYEYPKNSGLNWHDDYNHTLSFSIYIHEDWDENWGGETLIDTGRGLPLASIPYPNTLLCIKNNILHKVCAITSEDAVRKVLQCRYSLKG
tara:strand:- start:151 stop:723 length:573 start_codon:yes stop_codon:yes gene_type:complete